MSTSKRIDKICIAVIIITLIITILFMNGEKLGITVADTAMGYETRIFDTTKVHEIDIVMDDWDDFIENCEDEEYSNCTVVIDGEKYKNVGIRAKGNTSLSQVKQMDSERYSFKLEFDQYDSKKTYYGLDKLCLNNLIQDNTMMKDYLVYRMMDEFGVDSPLCSYTYITVNGEDWGLYLAVEGIEDSFLERNYDSEGDLYKPDSQSNGGGRGNGKDFDMDDRMAEIEEENGSSTTTTEATPDTENNASGTTVTKNETTQNNSSTKGSDSQGAANGNNNGTIDGNSANGTFPQMPNNGNFTDGTQQGGTTDSTTDGTKSSDKTFDFSNFTMPDMSNMGGGMGSDDVKLQYIDDDADSYSNIFDNAKTDVTDSDKERLIASLKSLNEYSDLENVLDTDEVLRYFVVHNFVCNGDSYTGSMIHNYYLYENDGQLSMIPWDYNLAFGTFQGGDASNTINMSIDSPVSSGSVDDRPMVGWIFSSDEYTNEYHNLFAEFIESFIDNGKMEEMIASVKELISEYVEKDPTKFCTYEEFETGVETIKQYMSLRGEAVSRQLQGNTEAVDTSGLNLSSMGTMNNTTGGGNNKPDFGGFGGESTDSTDSTDGETSNSAENGAMGTPPAGDNTTSGAMGTPPVGDSANGGTTATPPAGDSTTSGAMGTPPAGDSANDGTTATPPAGDNTTSGTQATPPASSYNTSDGNTQGNFNPFENETERSKDFGDEKGDSKQGESTASNATVKTVLIASGISFIVLIFGIVFAIKKKY